MQQQQTMNVDLYHVIGEMEVKIQAQQFIISQLQAQNKQLREQVNVLTAALADKKALEEASKNGQSGKLIDEVTKALLDGAKQAGSQEPTS